ncbi:MAG: hypothetical protein Q8N21_01425 [bacterium]|nr:hypothetical protein [bacterium]
MKNLIKITCLIICLVVVIGWFYFPETAEARSGCCSWHGGVCGCSCCDGTSLSATCAPYYPWCSGGYTPTPSYPSYSPPPVPSCPFSSYYDSISKSCLCNYGYVVGKDFLGKESCISGNSYCSDKYGYHSSYNSLNKICECGYGYTMSGGKCISEDDYLIQNSAPHAQNAVINAAAVEREKWLFSKKDDNLIKKIEGKILLQVEEKGEGWYVYPDDKKKYYLGRPADAFDIMRKLGLGATHQFIISHTIYPDYVLGKILLDVEQNGEAYYIYPKDKKAYYLGRPADAFRIMRELGLGITNSDVRKIEVGDVK